MVLDHRTGKQNQKIRKNDMTSPQKVSHDVKKGYAGLQMPVTTQPYIHKPDPNNPDTAQ